MSGAAGQWRWSQRLRHWLSFADLRATLREQKGRRARRAWQRVAERALVLLATPTLALLFSCTALRARQRPVDLLSGASWKVSSKYSSYLAPEMFFHTNQETEPNITYDLAKPTSFSSLTVENTLTYRERAVPLAAEVSDDGTTFRQVARTDQVFKIWQPHFARQKARYLRLRALKQTWLHLRRIEAHP